ncbi:MAG: hypothetical protein PHU25_07400 [Deltaproteobacteria bacterium]|nr:hypothetical protein [Deltaproteobacteria bacterium]
MWNAGVLAPVGLLAVATWVLLLSFDLRHELLYRSTLAGRDYDRACWVKKPLYLLVLGSSMSRYGVMPEVIAKKNRIPLKRIANVSRDAATPFVNYFTYLRRRDVLSQAKIVYVTYDPWMLVVKYHKHSPSQRLLWSYAQWRFMSRELGLAGSYFLPAVEAARTLVGLSGGDPPYCSRSMAKRRGFVPKRKEGKLSPVPEGQTEARTIYDDLDLFGPCTTQIDYLGRIKEMVEGAGGTFVLLLMPKHPFYIDVYRTKGEFDGRLRRLVNARLGPVRVTGSFDSRRYGLTDADFYDLSHLTESGARKFTAKEFASVKRHLLLKPGPLRPTLDY